MAEPEFRIVITPTRDGFHFKDPEHQAEVIRHLTAEALGQLSAPVQVRVVPAERIEGPSRFTATPAQIDAFLRTHFCEDRIQLYQWAIGDAAAHEAAEEIRTHAQAKYDRDFSDNRIFHLGGSKWSADLIDPAKGGGHYPSVLVGFARRTAAADAGTVDGIRPHRPVTPEQDAQMKRAAEQWEKDNPMIPERAVGMLYGQSAAAPAPSVPVSTCGVLHPRVAATCTEAAGHPSPVHRDAFGNTWPRSEGERPLGAPAAPGSTGGA